MTLWICPWCGTVRESEAPLTCVRVAYHQRPWKMVELTEEVGWLGPAPHSVYGKTASDRGYEWLADLAPDVVVLAR